MLSDKHIAEFQELYRQHFGEDISYEQATQKGERLVQLVKAVQQVQARQTDNQSIESRPTI